MSAKKMTKKPDLQKEGKGGLPADRQEWYYSELVKEHFFHPRNILLSDPKAGEFNAEGVVGAPICGDVMRMWLKVEPKTERIKELKWRTFGCATAIASTSVFSEMLTRNGGLTLAEALKVTPLGIVKELGGLPAIKIHCSVLADQAFKKAAEDYYKKKSI
ncbi:MAG: iron-sulfur cluster assembly scaffold protein [bacterium]|nr:iron-sulfur cluster assembly scaffold protein [bacterium]